jgi:hypothetical protein
MTYKVTLTTKPGVLAIGSQITLRKQPDNAYDNEAIQVFQDGKEVGYVAAFYKIRKPGTVSAGRLVDKIPDSIGAVVVADQVAEVEVA